MKASSIRPSPVLLVTVIATLLAFVTTFPLVLHLDSAIYGTPGDSTGAISIFWWWGYAVEHGKSVFDNTLLGAPIGSGWSQVPFAVLPLVVFLPLTLLFGSTAAYNLGALSSFPLSALFMFLLVRRVGVRSLAAAFSALAFAFIPYHQEKATGHMLQAHMELFPALLWLLLRWRQGGSRWNLVGAGGVLGLGVWIDYQFALIMLFLAAVFLCVSLALAPAAGPGFPTRLRDHLAGAGLVGVTVLPFLPLAILLAHRPGSSAKIGLTTRNLGDINIYSVRPWEYLMPWPANPLVPPQLRAYLADHLHGSNGVEQAQVLGYTVILLALAGLLWFRPRFPAVLGVAVIIAGSLLALPAEMHPFNHHLFGPAALLNRIVPYIRVYARFGVLVMLGTTMLAGLGFQIFEGFVRARRFTFLLFVPFLLVAVEFNSLPPTHTTNIFPAPDEYAWLARQPAGILIEYPVVLTNSEQEVEGRQYVLYQQVHLHPLFNGSAPTSAADLLAPSLDPVYGPGVVARLQALRIHYVFVHRRDYRAAGYTTPREVSGLDYVGSYDHGDVDVFTVSS